MSTTGLPITEGVGTASVATELVGGNSFQQIEVYGGGGASVLSVNPDGTINASIKGVVQISSIYGNISGSVFAIVSGLQGASVSGTVGASIIGAVPVTGTITINTPSVSGSLNPNIPVATSTFGITSVMTGTSSVIVLAAPGGTSRNYITHILVTNGAAVGTTVTIQDGASIMWGGYAAASGGGWSESFSVPLPQPTSVKALYATSSTQASVYVAVNGFTGA